MELPLHRQPQQQRQPQQKVRRHHISKKAERQKKAEAAALGQKKQNERKQYYEQQDQKTAIAKQREDRKWPTQVEKAKKQAFQEGTGARLTKRVVFTGYASDKNVPKSTGRLLMVWILTACCH